MTYEEVKDKFNAALESTPRVSGDENYPMASIKYVDSFQGTLILPGWQSVRHFGRFPLVQAFRILQKVKGGGDSESHLYIDV